MRAQRRTLTMVVVGAAVAGCAGVIASGGASGASSPPTAAPVPAAPSTAGQLSLEAQVEAATRVILTKALRDSAFPGAVAIIGRRNAIMATVAVGRVDWAPSVTPDASTVWDVASLTKVVGTTSAVMRLVDAGSIVLDAPVRRYLPEWEGPGKDRVTVRHLLTHTAGLPAFRQFYRARVPPDSTMALLVATPLDTAAGTRMVYSDIGAVLLGRIVERVSRQRLDAYLADHVFGPLGMADTRFLPPREWLPRIAPTEVVADRGGLVHGQVHDENALALGGVAGHAGLFSSARDLARFARMYLNGGALDGTRIFAPQTVALFTTRQDPALSHRALGWETPTGQNSAGAVMSPRAFGHTGFTGTSMWMDPQHDVFVILLSNRVNPTRENARLFPVRRLLADEVVSLVARADSLTRNAPRQ
jgi:serine-type D-Ala-D-Ala carboxypeptidase